MSSLFKKKSVQLPSPIVAPKPDGTYPDGRELPHASETKIIKLGIIVGHESRAPGAELATGGNEYKYNSEVADLLAQYAKHERPEIVCKVIKRDGIGIEGAYASLEAEKCDAVIELHFNAYNKNMTGTETLCSAASDDSEFAHIIQKAMCQVFGRDGQSRGVLAIGRNARGGQSVYAFPKGVNCLVEPFFGDNLSEAKMALEKKGPYAKALVDAVYLWASKKDLV